MAGAPFLVGTFTLALQGYSSDKIRRRGLIVLIFVPFLALCFMLLLIFTLSGPELLEKAGLRYMALFLGVSLGTCGGPLTLAVSAFHALLYSPRHCLHANISILVGNQQ